MRGQNRKTIRLRSVQARADNPEYIVRLIKQVVTVRVETVKMIKKVAKMGDT